jgi:hypothetical protein
MTAVQSGSTSARKGGKHVPQGRQAYYDTLRTLSQASVDQHFEAFRDIAWDDPDMQWAPGDERFILSEADELGRHPWYKSLPKERQVEVGMYRFAQIAKVGRQFEQILIAGVMHHLIGMENGNPEFRYAMHEVTEETHHIQMFQESVNRVQVEVTGAPGWFVRLAPVITSIGRWFPELFFVGILAGEEPIDHLQKSIMRAGGSHPLIDRIMQIHIAEEARHIGFAHQYLEHHWHEMGPVKRRVMTVMFPVTMRVLCDVIMVPSKADQRAMGIPEEVVEEIWWGSARSEKLLRDLFGDVRMLADSLGIRKGLARVIWKALGIDGESSRFRSAPSSARA